MKRIWALAAIGLLLAAAGGWVVFQLRERPKAADSSPHFRSPQTTVAAAKPRTSATTTGTGAGVAPGGKASPRKAAGSDPPHRLWDPEFLVGLRRASEGDAIRFELVDGERAAGAIRHLEYRNGEPIYVAGQLNAPEAGRFFFQKQTLPGKAGDFVGVVEFPSSQRAFRLEPTGPNGAAELVARPLDQVICQRLPRPAGAGTNNVEEIPPLNPSDFPNVPIPAYQSGIVVLESLPGSVPVIYMDFQGGYTPTWGGIAYARPAVNNSQIRDVWKRVAEDYMPFNINVTTDLKVFQSAPENGRQRVIITPTTTAAPGAGGVAYVGSFNWTGDTPCWVFLTSGKDCADAASHEAGHTVGLSHDGRDVNGVHTEYYAGQGSGATGWAPIMGVGYYQPVSQWCKGEYTNANNHQDQLAIIAGQNNNVTYRPDDTGDTLATSRYLELYPGFTAGAQGVIETTGDTDAFQFTTGGGAVSLRANPVGDWANLAISATLCDATDTVIASNNPQSVLWASITTNLPAGTYTFRVTGAGRNDPLTTGFSAYASLGYYSITGTVANARLPDRFSIPEHSPNGTLVGVVAAANPNGDPLTLTITAGNTGGAFALDDSGNLTVANQTMLDYQTLARPTQLPVQFELFVALVDTVDPTLTETNRRVVVAITDVNDPPTATGFSATVFAHTQPGTLLGQVVGADPDFYTLLAYSIIGGDTNGLFAIDNQTGEVRVAGDLNAAPQSLYQLLVQVSDQTPPTPLMATSVVAITVLPNATPFRPGTINYAVYTNITGNLVSSLTSAPSFPYDPAFEKPMPTFEGDTNRGINYGAVMRGYLLPPATGSYTFWIATDDNGELWLSSSTNPAAMTRIAYLSGNGNWAAPRQWNKYSSQMSAPQALVTGQAYYIEARMKQGTGNDNLAVAWQSADAGILTTNVIPGEFLAPYPVNYVPRASGFTYALHRDAFPGSRLGQVQVTDVNATDTFTFALTSGNTDGLFTLDPLTGVVRVSSDAVLSAATQTSYALQVRVTDSGSPPRSGTATVTINLVATNAITVTTVRQEIWTNIGAGTFVADLTNQPKYPKRPDLLRPLTSFDSGQNFGVNYGSRIRAYLTPTTSGAYTFFIASDDSSLLKFSSTGNPAAAVQIAYVNGYTAYQQWTAYSSQRSGTFTLVAGQRYYLESLHKQGGGADHVSVAWAGPGLAGTNPIAGAFLSPVDLDFAPDLAGQTAPLAITATNGAWVTTLVANDSPLDTLTFAIVSGNTNNTFAIDPDTGRIIVRDNTLIANQLVSGFNLGVQVQDSGYGGLYPLKVTQATVNVPIVEVPAAVWTGGGANDNWSLGANWGGAAPLDATPLIFSGANRQTNFNDLLGLAGPVTLNNGGFTLAGHPLTLRGGLVSVGDNTWAIDSALSRAQSFTNVSGTLTLAGAVDNNGNLLTVFVNDAMAINGLLSGTGGLTKSGPGALTLTAPNTFTGPSTLAAGSLVLSGAGSLADSPQIDVGNGATLDASGVAGGFTLAASQTLSGGGVVLGDVVALGTVSPGAFPATLTFSNALTLAGTTVLEIRKDGATLTGDSLAVGGALTFGGALVVTHTGWDLASGDAVPLFRAQSFSGSFANLTLPALLPGLTWNTATLAVDGTLRVAGVPLPQFLPPGAAGANLVLQFPSLPGVSYVLQQTSDLTPPAAWTSLSTNVGDGSLLTIPAPLDSTAAQRFFRFLSY